MNLRTALAILALVPAVLACSPPVDSTGPADDVRRRCGGRTCSAGFQCTSHGYCADANGTPEFGHVYLIVMENHSLSSIRDNASAPYINQLVLSSALMSNYGSAAHPSLPNYIALTAGDTLGVRCDCNPDSTTLTGVASCALAFASPHCPLSSTEHLGNALDAAHVAWRAYGEDMGTPCNTTNADHYVVRHIPFLYYDDIRTDADRCAEHVRDFGDFADDLAAGTNRFAMISPNLCHDMHDGCGGDAIEHGDTWLSQQVPQILATPGFQAGGTDVLFIVWDEQDDSTGPLDDPIPLIVVSPLAVAHQNNVGQFNHYTLLATISDGLGLTRLPSIANTTPLANVWR